MHAHSAPLLSACLCTAAGGCSACHVEARFMEPPCPHTNEAVHLHNVQILTRARDVAIVACASVGVVEGGRQAAC